VRKVEEEITVRVRQGFYKAVFITTTIEDLSNNEYLYIFYVVLN